MNYNEKLKKLFKATKQLAAQKDKVRAQYIKLIIKNQGMLDKLNTALHADDKLRENIQEYLFVNGVGYTVTEAEIMEMEREWNPQDYDAAEEAEIDLTQLGIELKAAQAAEVSSSNPPLAVDEDLVK